jgi:transcriptional regulator with XRE-family HTH domain
MSFARQLVDNALAIKWTHREIATKVGVSNAAITTYINGKYPAGVARLEAKIIAAFAVVACPFLGREISHAQCKAYASLDCPTSSPMALRHWSACRSCPLNAVRQVAA